MVGGSCGMVLGLFTTGVNFTSPWWIAWFCFVGIFVEAAVGSIADGVRRSADAADESSFWQS